MRRPARVGLSAMVLASLCLSMLAAPSADAEPFAGRAIEADATVRIEARNKKVLVLAIEARGVTGEGESWLSISAQVCNRNGDCKTPVRFVESLDEGDFTMEPDAKSASLSFEFYGAPLEVSWTSDANTLNGGVEAPNKVFVGPGGEAAATVEVSGLTCSGSGIVTSGAGVAVEDPPPAADKEWPAKAPKLLRKKGAECAP